MCLCIISNSNLYHLSIFEFCFKKQQKKTKKNAKNMSNKTIKIPPINSKNQIKLLQFFSDFSENVKDLNKIKMSLNDRILDFEGRSL